MKFKAYLPLYPHSWKTSKITKIKYSRIKHINSKSKSEHDGHKPKADNVYL